VEDGQELAQKQSVKENMKATITSTKNYSMFDFNIENRDFNPSKHRDLLKSLKEKGYDSARPIVCVRNARNRLEVVDGQHRLNFCRELKIPVYYTETVHGDPREYNTQQVSWSIQDWVKSWRCKGVKDYETLSVFAEKYKLPITTSANLLSGCDNNTGGTTVKKIKNGTFTVVSIEFAERCANAIAAIGEHFKEARSFYFVAAVFRCVKVDKFNLAHLISKIQKFPGELKPQARVDQYLEDIENLYNRADKKNQIPLRFLANQAAKK